MSETTLAEGAARDPVINVIEQAQSCGARYDWRSSGQPG